LSNLHLCRWASPSITRLWWCSTSPWRQFCGWTKRG